MRDYLVLVVTGILSVGFLLLWLPLVRWTGLGTGLGTGRWAALRTGLGTGLWAGLRTESRAVPGRVAPGG